MSKAFPSASFFVTMLLLFLFPLLCFLVRTKYLYNIICDGGVGGDKTMFASLSFLEEGHNKNEK